jgi:hypothetical protein
MRWQHTVFAFVTIACLVSNSHAEEKVADSPGAFIKDWATTFNKNSPEKQGAFYDRSEKIEVLVSSGLRHSGYKAVLKAYRDDQKQLKYYDSAAKKISTRLLGETAIVTFEHQFKMQLLADNSRWQIHIRTTSVLHRVENEWKIVLEHSSSIRGTERMTRLKK